MNSRNILVLFIFAITSIETFQIQKAAKVEDQNWENERDLDFRAVVCSECPQGVKPPSQCISCSEDADCLSDQVCCPFITLATTATACTSEQNKNCRLSNTIIVDFLRSVCSCVRQVKCCVKATVTTTTATVTTTTATVTEQTSTAEQSKSTETATSEASEATEPSTEESTLNSTEEWMTPSWESSTTSVAA